MPFSPQIETTHSSCELVLVEALHILKVWLQQITLIISANVHTLPPISAEMFFMHSVSMQFLPLIASFPGSAYAKNLTATDQSYNFR